MCGGGAGSGVPAPCLPQLGLSLSDSPLALGIDLRWAARVAGVAVGVPDPGSGGDLSKRRPAKLGPLSFPPGSGWDQEGLNLLLVVPCSSIHLQKANVPCGAQAACGEALSELQCSKLHTLK